MPCAHCLLSGLLPPAPDSKPTLCSIFRVTYLDVPSQRAGHPVLCTAPVSPTLVSVSIGMKEGINLKCIDDQVSTCLKKKKILQWLFITSGKNGIQYLSWSATILISCCSLPDIFCFDSTELLADLHTWNSVSFLLGLLCSWDLLLS